MCYDVSKENWLKPDIYWSLLDQVRWGTSDQEIMVALAILSRSAHFSIWAMFRNPRLRIINIKYRQHYNSTNERWDDLVIPLLFIAIREADLDRYQIERAELIPPCGGSDTYIYLLSGVRRGVWEYLFGTTKVDWIAPDAPPYIPFPPPIIETIEPDSTLDRVHYRDWLEKVRAVLTDREYDILTYPQGKTKECAEKYGICVGTVYNIRYWTRLRLYEEFPEIMEDLSPAMKEW